MSIYCLLKMSLTNITINSWAVYIYAKYYCENVFCLENNMSALQNLSAIRIFWNTLTLNACCLTKDSAKLINWIVSKLPKHIFSTWFWLILHIFVTIQMYNCMNWVHYVIMNQLNFNKMDSSYIRLLWRRFFLSGFAKYLRNRTLWLLPVLQVRKIISYLSVKWA